MKKTLLLLFALLTGVSGAWAKTQLAYNTLTTGVDYVLADNGQSWFLAQSGKTGCIIENNKYQLVAADVAGQYYLKQTSTGKYIATAGTDNANASWTSDQASAEKFTINKRDNDYQVRFVASSNGNFLNSASTGSNACPKWYNGTGDWSYWYVYTYADVYADFVATLPQLTTDLSSPKYYSIKSYNRGGYLTSNGAGQGMTHVDFADGSAWYFTAADGNTSGNVTGGVIAHCSDGTQMTTGWQTAATGGTIYILPNNVNSNGLSISKTASISGSSCCDANNTNTGVGNWSPNASDWEGTTWIFAPTVPIGPTGYYYFKGMATDRHPYLYSDFVGKSTNATYHHDLPETPSNGHVWKVTYQGTTLTATNGEGLPVTIGSSTYETLNLSAASVGPDYYFTEAINLTNWGNNNGNEQQLTTWTDGGSGASDNRWTFELVDVSAGVYNVVIQGNNDGYVTYSGQNAKNGGFFVASSIAVGDLTAYDIDGYTEVVSVEGRTITVTYNEQLSYTLTDTNGATYEGTYEGIAGVTPTFTGCSGYTLTGGSWSGTAYSATINFPFAVSSNSVDNPTFLGSFHTKSGYLSEDFLWHASGSNVIVHSGDIPDVTQEDQEKYQWIVEPSISGLNITFTIKNVSTGTYISSTTTSPGHSGTVILSGTASPLTYSGPLSLPSGSSSTATSIYAFIVSSTSLYLSVNSVSGAEDSQLGVHNVVHDGISVGFHTFADLISRYWTKNNIAAEIAKAGQYGYPAPSEGNTAYLLWAKGAMDRGAFDYTKANYNNLLTWFEGFLAADVVAPADGDFLRIKASDTNKKAWSLSASNLYLTSSNCASKTDRVGFAEGAATDNTTIFYYNGTTITGFANGLQPINNNDNQMQIGTAGAVATTVSFEAINGTEQHAFRVEFKGGNRSMYTQRSSTTPYYYYTDAAGADATDAHYRYFLEKVTSLPITLNDGGDGNHYATLCLPCDVTISDATAYTLAKSGSWLVPTAVTDNKVPAGTAVLLKGTNETATATINTGGAFNSGSPLDCALTGVTQATTIDGTTDYVLGIKEGVVGFYHWNQNVLSGFRAYLDTPAASGVKGFAINWGGETGVEAIEHSPLTIDHEAGTMFDLSGRRVSKAQKGLYIQNGKKVMVK